MVQTPFGLIVTGLQWDFILNSSELGTTIVRTLGTSTVYGWADEDIERVGYTTKPIDELQIGDKLYDPKTETVSAGYYHHYFEVIGTITQIDTTYPYFIQIDNWSGIVLHDEGDFSFPITEKVFTPAPIILTAGRHTRTVTKSARQTATIAYGFTYLYKPSVLTCLYDSSGANADVCVHYINKNETYIEFSNRTASTRTISANWLAIGQ